MKGIQNIHLDLRRFQKEKRCSNLCLQVISHNKKTQNGFSLMCENPSCAPPPSIGLDQSHDSIAIFQRDLGFHKR